MPALLELHHIGHAIQGHGIIQDLNLSIEAGEFFTLLGPSGCGKTTLLRLISGTQSLQEGSILLNGVRMDTQRPEDRPINTVFQDYALFPHLNVWDNVAFGLQCESPRPVDWMDRVHAALEAVGLEKHHRHRPSQLSGGQQQRVAIARAVVKEPKLLLLDEPMSALDYHLRKHLRVELKKLQRRLGIAFILVTHDQEEALALADRVAVMHDGQLMQVGTPRELYEQPLNQRIARFIGEANFFQSTVLDATPQTLQTTIADIPLTLPNKKGFSEGQAIDIMIRPEDFSVWHHNEVKNTTHMLPGKVDQVIYKGSTVDLIIQLRNGQTIFATEFFDEDDEKLSYKIGEPVWLAWIHGWEVIFHDRSR